MPNITDNINTALEAFKEEENHHGSENASLENLSVPEDAPFSSHGTTESINDTI